MNPSITMRTIIILLCALLTISADSFAQLGQAADRTEALRNINRGRAGAAANLPLLLVVDESGKKISGNSTAKEKKDYIKVAGFSQQSYLPIDETTGKIKDQVFHGELKVVKGADEASPVLLEMMSSNERLKRVELVLFGKTGEGEETEEYLIRLEGARVISVKTSMNVSGNSRNSPVGPIREEVIFSYESIYWSAKDGLSAFGSN